MSQLEKPGRPVQIVRKKDNNTFELDGEALKTILLAPSVKDKPVVVVSVAGAFRKGKSFLLDFFLRYMQSDGENGWLGDPKAPLRGFSWRGGTKGDTTGILLWSEVFLVTTLTGQQVAVLLMDTQGAFDPNDTVKGGTTIFALSIMTSSVQVYNLSQNIQDNDLKSLEYFAEYGRLAQEAQQGTQAKPFQKLLFLVRDWSVPYEFDYGTKGGNDFLASLLNITKDMPQEQKTLRERLKSCFSQIDCFLMPHPGLKVSTDKNFCGKLLDIDDQFQKYLQILVPSLLAADKLLLKEVNGQKITCNQLMDYFKAYEAIFKSDKLPEPHSTLEATAKVHNLQAMDTAKGAYMSAMEKLLGDDQPYLSPKKMQDRHNEEKALAMMLFSETLKFGGTSNSEPHLQKLGEDIEKSFLTFSRSNEMKARLRTTVVLMGVAVGAATASMGLAAAGVAGGALAGMEVAALTNLGAVARSRAVSNGPLRQLYSFVDTAANFVWDGFDQGLQRAGIVPSAETKAAEEQKQPLMPKQKECKGD